MCDVAARARGVDARVDCGLLARNAAAAQVAYVPRAGLLPAAPIDLPSSVTQPCSNFTVTLLRGTKESQNIGHPVSTG